MDISQFLLALRARRKAFMLALLVTIATAVAVSLVVPKKYVGQAVLLVDSRDEQAMTPMRIMSLRDRTSYVATQIELIQTGRVATQVAHDLKLAQNPALREAFEKDTGGVGPIDVWIGQMLLDKLKVTNTASNLIAIEYSSAPSEHPALQIRMGRESGSSESNLGRTLSRRTSNTCWSRKNEVTPITMALMALSSRSGLRAMSARASARLAALRARRQAGMRRASVSVR